MAEYRAVLECTVDKSGIRVEIENSLTAEYALAEYALIGLVRRACVYIADTVGGQNGKGRFFRREGILN